MSYRDTARELSKRAEVLSGYIKDHAEQIKKFSEQLADLSKEIEKFGEQVGELEKK